MTPTPTTYISLRYLTQAQLGSISPASKSDPSDDQPGWFVAASYKEGYENVLKLTRITAVRALRIAQEIDRAAVPDERMPVTERVTADIRAHNRLRDERRAHAEAQIERFQRVLDQLDREET